MSIPQGFWNCVARLSCPALEASEGLAYLTTLLQVACSFMYAGGNVSLARFCDLQYYIICCMTFTSSFCVVLVQ